MTHLYELTDEIKKIADNIESAETCPDEIYGELVNISGAFIDKAENIAKFVLNLNADIEALEKEELRINRKRKTLESKHKWIRDYLKHNIEILGLSKIKGDILTLSIQKNPYSVTIVDENIIPAYRFTRVIPERREVDKIAILKNFSETGEIPDGIKIEQTTRLVIK